MNIGATEKEELFMGRDVSFPVLLKKINNNNNNKNQVKATTTDD